MYVLSSMARRRRTSQSSSGAVSPDRRLSKGAELVSGKLCQHLQNQTDVFFFLFSFNHRRVGQSPSPRSSSDPKKNSQISEPRRRIASRWQQCHTHEVQAANERLHAVCQEIPRGIHADVPRKRQQVGVISWNRIE